MKHYGDITKINGAAVEAVDVICGGSPCQDLSVAKTNRAGLAGARSGLFMDQIRIIKEMRKNELELHCGRTNDAVRCRFMVWENVCGALSSNNGEDFRAVLEETARICSPNAYIPEFRGGRWPNSGAIMGEGWSIAWRVHDAQFWGVPQRRRRIALVADFGGQAAAEVLFERKSMSGSFEQEEGLAGRCTSSTSETIEKQKDVVLIEFGSTKHQVVRNGICMTLKARMGTGGNNVNATIREDGIYKLSPKECERLQGFPDDWTNIGDWTDSKWKLHKASDSTRYKALGNSIALPFWQWLAERIAKHLPQGATMASLFDGIGGFPLVFSRAGVRPVWASEIEEFPIAVTKYHFPEKEEQNNADSN